MAKHARVFPRREPRLTPAQVRAVADQRLGDASCLHATGLRRHANGVVYLCGLTVDCLLKARLLEKHPHIRSTDPADMDSITREVWRLVYQRHDLEAMIARLPEVPARLATADARGSTRLVSALKAICAAWSIRARYNTRQASRDEAEFMFDHVKELRPWLD